MNHLVSFSVVFSLLCVQGCVCSVGPVFVNAAEQPAASSVANGGNYVTQTVYGFLDFTTTIGNTVMVFSPQSAAAPEPKKEPSTEPSSVIVTKPGAPEDSRQTISPSKTQVQKEKPSENKLSSVVHVQANPAGSQSGKTEIKSLPSSEINVIRGVSSVVNIADAPAPSSKVEVVAAGKQQNVITKVEVITSSKAAAASSRVEIQSSPVTTSPVVLSSVVEIHTNEEPAVIVGNNIGEPEYDFLSRQPSEVVEETYKVINLKPSSKFHLKPRPSADPKNKPTKRAESPHPTGLVTKLGGTVVKDGVTTVHETSVIGTYISGKYAQVLQSTSRIHSPPPKGKISPSPTLRILKTAAPALGKSNKNNRQHLEPTPAATIVEETALPVENLFNSQNVVKSTRKPSTSSSSSKQSFKNRPRKHQPNNSAEENSTENDGQQQYKKKSQRNRGSQNPRTSKQYTPTSQSPTKHGRSPAKTTTISVHSEEPTPAPSSGKRFQSRRNKQQQQSRSSAPENNPSSHNTRRAFKPKVQPSAVEQSAASTSLYKFKLNRSPGRWQYKTTPKPRITIRKQSEDEGNATTPTSPQDVSPLANDVVTPQARSDDVDGLVGSESIASIIDDESSTENKLDTPFPLETIRVEISTPPDFKDIYYEIATIKTPYTFQVGSVKNTRYITVTSTFEKSFANTESISPTTSEPLTENILATSSNYAKDNNFLDSSIATLPPLYLASDMETPPLETLTETFSTTQTMLKTHVLPVVRGGNDTSSSTLVQTYLITRLVTATKTLPPMDAYHFIPSKTLNEFNSHLDEAGSELHLELEFGDDNEQDEEGHQKKLFPPDLDLANVGSEFNLSDVDKSKIPEGHLKPRKLAATTPKPITEATPPPPPALSPEQLQQLALLRLLNPAAVPSQQGQVITTSKPVVKVETVYESHVLPIINGASTLFTTISKIVGTVTKTDYEFGTSTLAPALPLPPVNPLFPQQQPQIIVTSSPVVQNTVITETNSKVLKLTFGAKTAYTTIFSTKVVPTVLTTYMTASVPVQPTAAFPGFFPAPYPPYPYVG